MSDLEIARARRQPKMAAFKVTHSIADDTLDDTLAYHEHDAAEYDPEARPSYADTALESSHPKWAKISEPVRLQLAVQPATHRDLNVWATVSKAIHRWHLHDALCWLLLNKKIEKVEDTKPAIYRAL